MRTRSTSSTDPGAGRALALVALALALLAALPATAAAASKAFVEAYAAAKTLYDAGNYEAALAGFEKARAIEPAAEVLYNIARCHHRLEHTADAALAYEAFLSAAPDHKGVPAARGYLVEVLRTAGTAALERLDFAAARAAFERARAVHARADPALTDATSGALLARLGDALAELRERDAAIAVYGRALGAALSPEERTRVETRLGALMRALPETRPGPGPTEPPPATRPAGPLAPESAVSVGAGRPGGATPTDPTRPPPRRGELARSLPWLVAACVVAVAGAVTGLVVGLRPGVDDGWHSVVFRP